MGGECEEGRGSQTRGVRPRTDQGFEGSHLRGGISVEMNRLKISRKSWVKFELKVVFQKKLVLY